MKSCHVYIFKYVTFSLKMQQGLLVDFGAFPQNVIDLLNSVLAEEQKELPKWVAKQACKITALPLFIFCRDG